MNHVLRAGSFDAWERFKTAEPRVTRWFDDSAQQQEPLYELFEDELIVGMSSHASYDIDYNYNFKLMKSKLEHSK